MPGLDVLLRVLRGLRVVGAFLHGGTRSRAVIIIGACIFGGIAATGPSSLVGGLLSYAGFAFVGYLIYRASRRVIGGGVRG